ncbi:helix-turn-helix domain-containing protein [Chitinophaga defluvii]|uniref:AraC family transcriptional regulator n=1 Tax=Chitinophaga defluvii TaxID=3163343 RepID=A0ABV2SZF9_9BACT
MTNKEISLTACPDIAYNQEMYYVDEKGAASHVTFNEFRMEGVEVFFASSRQEREVVMKDQRKIPSLNMYFSLKGSCGAVEEDKSKHIYLDDNEHVLGFTPYFNGHYELISREIRNFGICMEESFYRRFYSNEVECLQRFWEDAHTGRPAFISPRPMQATSRQLLVIRDMMQCVYSGQMKELFFESRIIELFLHQVEQAEGLKNTQPVKIKAHHIDRLHAARHLIQQHLFDPLTLQGISRQTGLNEFSLKKGFKELFGVTVFGYLHELKMNYARKMLLDTSCTVYEVAYTVGYTEPYNFSRAFKKHFGYLPGEVRRYR